MTGPHTLVNPEEMGPPSGFSHAVVAAPGRLVHVAGQVGAGGDGTIVDGGIAAQFAVALARVVTVLAAAGGAPDDVVSMVLYTTALAEYRAHRVEIGEAYREHFGHHFPAMTLVGVTELLDAGAVIEVAAVAVVRDNVPPGGPPAR